MSARQGEMPVTLTEHKELEIYRRIFFASSDYISFSRLNDGIYIDVNPGFERLMGFKRADVIGRTSLEVGIWPESWVEQRAMYIEALRRDGMVRDYPGCLKTATGKIIDVEASATVVEIDGEQILVTIVRDVSKRKQAEEELNESTARLQFILESGQIGDWDRSFADEWEEMETAIAALPALGRFLPYWINNYREDKGRRDINDASVGRVLEAR